MSALGAGAPSPDHLLAQIRSLLGQYLAMGSDTPVAPQAQQLADAIDQITGGGDQLTGSADQAPMSSGDTPMPDMTGGQPLDQQQSGGYKDFKSAAGAAKGDIAAILSGKKKSKGK